jgi:hypothetical protein
MKKSILAIGSLLLCAGLSAQVVHFSEDFEGGTMPVGWTGAGSWVVADAATGSSGSFPIPAHTYFAVCNDDASQSAANANVLLSSPVINLSAATAVFLKFDSYFWNETYQSITETADVKYSTDGGTTWTSAGNVAVDANAWTTNVFNLTSQLSGQSNVKIAINYNDGGGWLYGIGIDNIELMEPAAIEAELAAVTPAANTPQAFALSSSNVTLGGTFVNNGLNNVTSITVKWFDGTNTFTQNLTSLNVAPFASYTFTHSTPFTVPAVGPHTIWMWVELAGDADVSNDTMTTVIQGISFLPVHHVTIEEGTGTWCGWCPRGTVFMDSMNAVHPNTTHLIAVHNGDPMTNATYDGGMGGLIPGYPSVLVNRNILDDPSNIFNVYNSTINDFGYADLVPTVTFNNTTRVCSVQVAATFAASLQGDYRLAVVFTEDSVTGTTATYGQTNYYSGGGNGPMGGYENLPATVPASQMHYDFVARQIVGGFNGQAGSLPATITAGNTYNATFSYTIPAAYNVARMKVHVLLIDNESSTVTILNAAGGAVPLGVNEQTGIIAQSSLYPNPSSTTSTLSYTLASSDEVTINVYNAMGELVSSQNEGSVAAGTQYATINTEAFANGIYMVELVAGDSKSTTRMVVSH